MWQHGARSASPPQVDPPLAGPVCPLWSPPWGPPVHLACPEGTYDPGIKSPLHTMSMQMHDQYCNKCLLHDTGSVAHVPPLPPGS